MTLAVGIDAGGTKLAAGLVDLDSGQVLARRELPSQPKRGGDAVLADCESLARGVARSARITAIGVGVPELVSLEGAITSAVLWDWRDGRWRSVLERIAPARAVSDVRAAALAEARFGAGRGRGSFIYLSVGTGISQALVINGVVWSGARGNAVIMGAPPVEDIASGAALSASSGVERVEQLLASESGVALVEDAARALGIELARLVNALDPAAVVIGGGLGLSDMFRTKVTASMRPEIYAEDTRTLDVVAAGLGQDVGVIGAALATQPA